MKGLGLPVLGPDLWLPDGCQVGAAHCQQSAATAGTKKKRVIEEEEEEEEEVSRK